MATVGAQEWQLTEASQLLLAGTSSVNSFECEATTMAFDYDVSHAIQGTGFSLPGMALVVPVRDLDCDNRRMNRDMRNTMRAEEHPNIRLEVHRIDLVPETSEALAAMWNTERGKYELAGNLLGAVLALMGIGLFVIAVLPNPIALAFALICTSVGTALFNASALSLASHQAHQHERGAVLGVAQSMQALGRSVGPMMAGLLFDFNAGLPFYMGSGLVGIMLLALLLMFQKTRQNKYG